MPTFNDIRGPRVILEDVVKYTPRTRTEWHRFFSRRYPNPEFLLYRDCVEGIYDKDGNPLWQNEDYPGHQPAIPREEHKGLQIAMSDHVKFVEADTVFLSFYAEDVNLTKRRGFGEKGLLLSTSNLVKAVYDKDGELIWKNQ